MPKWEPPIEATRLADAAVQTRVLADGAVNTLKLDNLAVTDAKIMDATITKLKIGDQEVDVQRMLDPVDWDWSADVATNQTLDTTKRHQLDVTSNIPSWAGEAFLFGVGEIQVTNSSGSDYEMVVAVLVDDVSTPSSGSTTTIVDGTVDTGFGFFTEVIVAPGSTIETRLWGWLSAGTNSVNAWTLDIAELFKR